MGEFDPDDDDDDDLRAVMKLVWIRQLMIKLNDIG